MRIIHTSDWHLGHELHGFERGHEHDVFLEWLIGQIGETRADVLLVTGDVYDVANPAVDAQQRLYRFLREAMLVSGHSQIIVIGGNHDSAARLELPKDLLDRQRVRLVGSMPRHEGRIDPREAVVELRNANGDVAALCVAVPFLRPGDLPAAEQQQNQVAALYQNAVEAARCVRRDVPLIVTGHLYVSGAEISEMSERRIMIGGAEAIPTHVFPADAAYIALGHLHKPQQIAGIATIRYAGAPFPMSVSERDYKHSIALVEIEAGGTVVSLIPTPRPVEFLRVPDVGALPLDLLEHQLRNLEIEAPDLLAPAFIEVAIQLDKVEPDLRRRIEDALEGKPVRLTRIVRHAAGEGGTLADAISKGAELSQLEPVQVFTRLHVAKFATEPPQELTKAFAELVSTAAGEESGEAVAS